jgi:hypothetical protein
MRASNQRTDVSLIFIETSSAADTPFSFVRPASSCAADSKQATLACHGNNGYLAQHLQRTDLTREALHHEGRIRGALGFQ